MSLVKKDRRSVVIIPDRDILDYNGDISSQSVIDQAESLNCEVVYSTDMTLLLDLDIETDWEFFIDQYYRFIHSFGLRRYEVYISRGGNRHVIIQLANPVPIKERIMMQAILGSDRVREGLSLMRVENNDPNPSILLKPIRKEA